ncbi:hypothetical protein WMY93_033305 [Mugilogobius chulae]|uniref:TRAF-type domain-containing protein n=1 Tax=Mugilogobius chulae TaxID=88201 RepID=A0AAW0MTP9_9GOBI
MCDSNVTLSSVGFLWVLKGPQRFSGTLLPEKSCRSKFLSKRNNGCKEQLSLQQLPEHLTVCPWQELPCPLGRCSERLMRKDVPEHLNWKCKHRETSCDFCLCKMPLSELQLQVSPCLHLSELQVSPCQHLSELQVSPSLHLSELQVSPCLHLSELQVSPCLHLSELQVSPCQHLSELQVSPCLHLSELQALLNIELLQVT